MWGKAIVEFITSTSQKIRDEIIPMAVLVTDRAEEESLDMVTTFCHYDQTKVEPSVALSILLQCDSPEPSIVVVKIFTNSPYLPWGPFSFPYLDITTLSVGTLTTQFPLAQVHICRLLPFSSPQVALLCKKDDKELKVYPFLQEALWENSKEDHHLPDPCCCWFFPLTSLLIEKRAHRLRRSLASAWLWHGDKALPGSKPNWNKS